MNLFLSSLLSFVLLYKYWALSVIIFSGALILPFPANALLVAMGAFASQGYANIFVVLFLAIFTNVLGDCFGFFLTYKYGQKIIDKFIPQWDAKIFHVEKFLRNYAFGTIFLTRIAGPFEPYVNFLSGVIGVSFRKFLLAGFLGNTLSIAFFVVAGYILGNYWQEFINDMWVIGAAVFIMFLIYLAYKTIKKRQTKL